MADHLIANDIAREVMGWKRWGDLWADQYNNPTGYRIAESDEDNWEDGFWRPEQQKSGYQPQQVLDRVRALHGAELQTEWKSRIAHFTLQAKGFRVRTKGSVWQSTNDGMMTAALALHRAIVGEEVEVQLELFD